MADQSQGNTPQTQGIIVEVPGTPQRNRMDIVQSSPDKEVLKSEVGQLRTHLAFVMNHSENAMRGQQARFLRTAQQYEQMARDVTESEVAQATADVTAQYTSRIFQAEQCIAQEAEVALHTQEQSVVTQAESYMVHQETNVKKLYQEEMQAYKDKVDSVEEHANKEYTKLHESASHTLQQGNNRMEAMWTELNQAKSATANDSKTIKEQQDKIGSLEQTIQKLQRGLDDGQARMKQFQLMFEQNEKGKEAQKEENERNNAELQKRIELRIEEYVQRNAELQKQMEDMQDVVQDQYQRMLQKDESIAEWEAAWRQAEQQQQQQQQQKTERQPSPEVTKEKPDPQGTAAPVPDPPQPYQPAPTSPRTATPKPHKAVTNLGNEDPQGTRSKEADCVTFPQLPKSHELRGWKIIVKRNLAAASGRPRTAVQWFSEADQAQSIEELEDDGTFETLSSKIASALLNIIHGEFKRQIEVIEEKLLMEGKMLNGRQLYFLVLKDRSRPTTDDRISTFEDLLRVQMNGDNLRRFQTDWEKALLVMQNKPADEVLEALYKRQIQDSKQLEQSLILYNLETTQQGKPRSYERLTEMVVNHLNAKRDNRNSQEPRQHANAAKEGPAADDCRTYWWKGACPRGAACAFKHNRMSPDAKGKGKGTKGPKGAGKGKGKDKDRSQSPGTRRGRTEEREQSPRRSGSGQPTRGNSPSGKKNRLPCKNHMKGECKKGKDCDFWHPQQCKFIKDGGTCKYGKDCQFVHPPKAKRKDSPKADKDKKGKVHIFMQLNQ